MNSEIENAIASDFRTLESTVKRLHVRLSLYNAFDKKEERVDALVNARASIYFIEQEVKRLKEYLEKV